MWFPYAQLNGLAGSLSDLRLHSSVMRDLLPLQSWSRRGQQQPGVMGEMQFFSIIWWPVQACFYEPDHHSGQITSCMAWDSSALLCTAATRQSGGLLYMYIAFIYTYSYQHVSDAQHIDAKYILPRILSNVSKHLWIRPVHKWDCPVESRFERLWDHCHKVHNCKLQWSAKLDQDHLP